MMMLILFACLALPRLFSSKQNTQPKRKTRRRKGMIEDVFKDSGVQIC